MVSHDPALQAQTVQMYRELLRFNGADHFLATPNAINGPSVAEPYENAGRSSFTPAIATPEVSQWGINLITVPELVRQFRSGPADAAATARP